ncbi:MAG: hypothetical protein L6305_06550 [Actinomycetia bacterium]|nr:hypothetical protein [Actinomycetes bacterium]
MQAKFFIQDVYNITGMGPIPVGQVKEGVLRLGMKLNLNNRIMTVTIIEMHHTKISEAKTGDNVGITLGNADLGLLKSASRSEVIFSDEGTPTKIQLKQSTVQPEGVFGFLKKIFRK